MDKERLFKIAKDVSVTMRKHSPEILTGIGITGMITTTILAVRATPKAMEIIEEERCDRWKLEGDDYISKRDLFKLTWKCYLPSAVIGSVSVCCLIGASSENLRRNTALATAYSLSESSFKEYQEKTIEKFGEKKEREVRDDISQDRLNRQPVSTSEVVITGKGNTLCFDSMFGRYFESDIGKIERAENELNRRMLNEMYVCLNDFYFELGIDPIPAGYDVGWNINRENKIDIGYSSKLADDGRPCLVLTYRVEPRPDYQR